MRSFALDCCRNRAKVLPHIANTALVVNKVTDILPAATFELSLEPSMYAPEIPPKLANASPLPATLVDRLKDAAPWVAPHVFSNDKLFLTYIHVAGRKVYAGQSEALVEYDLGDADVPWFAIEPRQIKLLAAFGEPPIGVSFPDPVNWGRRVQFKWNDERRLSLVVSNGHYDASCTDMFASFITSRNDLEPITDDWREQIEGRFSAYKTRGETDLLHITNGKIEGGIAGSKITLETDTHCDGEAWMQRQLFLRAIKIADRIKFSEVEQHQRMFFEGPNVRGIVTTGRKP